MKLYSTTNTLFLISLTTTLSLGNSVDGSGGEPDFISGVKNVTVPEGRDVTLSCSVRNLGSHKVAWIHYDRSAILTVQNNVITRNPRIGVSHDGVSVWNLHIKDVERSDEGQYMCQINTARAKTRLGNLHVVVPPRILDGLSSSDMVQTEGSNVSLECVSAGSPDPSIIWRREDGKLMNINKNESVEEVEGHVLKLWKVSRMDMGAYMCIARNGVPPSVSKRIQLGIDFPPMLWVPAQLVSVYSGDSASLTCFVEAHPASLNYWEKDGEMIHQDDHFTITQSRGSPAYKVEMSLVITSIRNTDFGKYKCVAKNPRGQTDGTISLYEKKRPSTIPQATTTTMKTTTLLAYKVRFDHQVNSGERDKSGFNTINQGDRRGNPGNSGQFRFEQTEQDEPERGFSFSSSSSSYGSNQLLIFSTLFPTLSSAFLPTLSFLATLKNCLNILVYP